MNDDAVRALVDEQAEDEGLWFIATTMPEAYLQQELRRLHALIEAAVPAPTPDALAEAVRELLYAEIHDRQRIDVSRSAWTRCFRALAAYDTGKPDGAT